MDQYVQYLVSRCAEFIVRKNNDTIFVKMIYTDLCIKTDRIALVQSPTEILDYI